jgi:hypothetical protein
MLEGKPIYSPEYGYYECRLCGHGSSRVSDAEAHARACPEQTESSPSATWTYAAYYERRRPLASKKARKKNETFAERRVRRFVEEGRPL